MTKPTKQDVFKTVSKSLVEFGYRDCTPDMVKDTWEAILAGKSEMEMPHGIIGRFAWSQLNENRKWIERLL